MSSNCQFQHAIVTAQRRTTTDISLLRWLVFLAHSYPYDFDENDTSNDYQQSSDNIDDPPQYSSSISAGSSAIIRNSLEAGIFQL